MLYPLSYRCNRRSELDNTRTELALCERTSAFQKSQLGIQVVANC